MFDVRSWRLILLWILEVGSWTLDLGSWIFSNPSHHLQILPIPRRRNAFSRRIRTRLIRAGDNPLLAQLAHAPILAIGHIPKFDGVIRMKVCAPEGIRMKKPIANDEHTFRRLRPELMHH